MKLDERARIASRWVADESQHIAVPTARHVVRSVHRHHRTRTAAAIALVAIMVAIPVAIDRARSDSPAKVGVAAPVHGTSSGQVSDARPSGVWSSVQKSAEGLGDDTWLTGLISTSDAFIVSVHDDRSPRRRELWRSTNGIQWQNVTPSGFDGSVNAVGAHDDQVLVIADETVWLSHDDGLRWTASTTEFAGPTPGAGPFISTLRWSPDGFWIAAGGGLWTSTDGARWDSVLTSNDTEDIDVVEDGNGGMFAYTSTGAWSSPNGREWTPIGVSLPAPYALVSVAPGASLAIGADLSLSNPPSRLLRSDDHGQTWTEDLSFHDAYPFAAGSTIVRDAHGWMIAGLDYRTDRVGVWTSTDTFAWAPMGESLRPEPNPNRILHAAASVGDITVVIGSAPELDRYFVFDQTDRMSAGPR